MANARTCTSRVPHFLPHGENPTPLVNSSSSLLPAISASNWGTSQRQYSQTAKENHLIGTTTCSYQKNLHCGHVDKAARLHMWMLNFYSHVFARCFQPCFMHLGKGSSPTRLRLELVKNILQLDGKIKSHKSAENHIFVQIRFEDCRNLFQSAFRRL